MSKFNYYKKELGDDYISNDNKQGLFFLNNEMVKHNMIVNKRLNTINDKLKKYYIRYIGDKYCLFTKNPVNRKMVATGSFNTIYKLALRKENIEID